MELVRVGLWGYKRFEDDFGDMDVLGPLIAVVGPNEAGKTSFLRALEHLNGSGGFDQSEFTRGASGKICVRARFALTAGDKAAIAPVGGIGSPRIFHLWKREGGHLSSRLEPPLQRDVGPREQAQKALARVAGGRWATKQASDDARELLDELERALVKDEDKAFDSEEIEALRGLIARVRAVDQAPPSLAKLGDQLEKLADLEALPDPDDAACSILTARGPRFLWFDEDWRQLESQFSVRGQASPAMRALFALIGFDLNQLVAAIDKPEPPRVTELVEEANQAFDTFFHDRWRQANIRITIDVDGEVVRVYVRNAKGRLIPIADRSEGLRHFLALLAFVETEGQGQEVVLLIDEAEAHLHYDAQADLIRVFTNQAVADKIVYTTHSAGCLPLDLGTGIRVIEPVGPEDKQPEDWERSRIRNWFWSDGPGFSPLLLAMGASTLAFAATRRAVIAEGISDVTLVPTLVREATGKETLDFQVAPGLASVRPREVPELSLEAARVAYLVDGDKSGLGHKKKLIKAGVSEGQIVVLGGGAEPLSLEDLLVKDVYVNAVNLELERRTGKQIDPALVPDVERKTAITTWCKRHRLEPPSERAVAQHILDARRQAAEQGDDLVLLDPARQTLVTELHAELERILELSEQAAPERAEPSASETLPAVLTIQGGPFGGGGDTHDTYTMRVMNSGAEPARRPGFRAERADGGEVVAEATARDIPPDNRWYPTDLPIPRAIARAGGLQIVVSWEDRDEHRFDEPPLAIVPVR